MTCSGTATPQRGGILARYLFIPKARSAHLAAVAPHEGENRLLWMGTEARAGSGATHGGKDNRWLLRTEASRPNPR
jgi:hypothetical protein